MTATERSGPVDMPPSPTVAQKHRMRAMVAAWYRRSVIPIAVLILLGAAFASDYPLSGETARRGYRYLTALACSIIFFSVVLNIRHYILAIGSGIIITLLASYGMLKINSRCLIDNSVSYIEILRNRECFSPSFSLNVFLLWLALICLAAAMTQAASRLGERLSHG